MLSYFLSVKKKKALERKTKHNSNFSELGPKYFLGFLLPSCCSLADQAPWTPFPIWSTTGHVHSAQATGAKYHCLIEDSQPPGMLPWTACPKNHFLTSLCIPGQGRILQLFHYFFCLFLTITAETLRPVRVTAVSYLQCFLYCLPRKRAHPSKCGVMDWNITTVIYF